MGSLSYDEVLAWLDEGKVLITVNSRLRDKLVWRYAEIQQQKKSCKQ